MHGKTTGSLVALLGLAGVAALGAILAGKSRGSRAGDDLDEDMELAHRDTLAALIGKYARMPPDDEADAMLRRNRSKLLNW